MNKIKIPEFKLIGLQLPDKTSNERGQSSIDCGALWQKFNAENIQGRIPEKLTDEIYAVYFDYEGDHTKPFSYFIGCKVIMDTKTPKGMDSMIIPAGNYSKVLAKGKMPDCVVNSWKEIWATKKDRAYQFDFEIYDDRSKDWNNAEVEIYLSSL